MSVDFSKYLLIEREHVRELAQLMRECAAVTTREEDDAFTAAHDGVGVNAILNAAGISLETALRSTDAEG